MISERAIQLESRHALFANRYAGGLHRDFLPLLTEIYNGINDRIIRNYDTNMGKRRFNALLRDVTEFQAAIYQPYIEGLFSEVSDFAISESEFELESLTNIANRSPEMTLPAPAQVLAALSSAPLVFPDSNDVILLERFLKGYSDSQIKRIENVIRTGFFTGSTVDDMARAISGTTKQARQANRAIVRTAVNHASAEARSLVMEENDDVVIGYRWLSTLDDRTSAPCRALDGREFKWSDSYKPKPPLHVACRSTTVPLLSDEFVQVGDDAERGAVGSDGRGTIDAKTTYYSFLKQQSRAFQIDVLGKDRAKLFRDGGLSADEFAKLSVDDKFRPLSLDEMKAKNPLVFERANIKP